MNVLSAIAGRIRFDEEDIVQVVKWPTLWCLSSTALSPTRRELQRLYCLWGSPLQRTHTSGEICRSQSFKLGNVTLCMQEWRSNSASHFKVTCWVERLRELFFPGQKASKLLALYQLWQGPVNFTAKSALPFGETAVLSAEKREAVFTSDSKVFFRGCFDWGPKIRTAHRVAEVQLWGQSTGMFYSAATQHVQQHDSGKGSCKDHLSYWPNRDSSGQKLRACSADGFTVARC